MIDKYKGRSEAIVPIGLAMDREAVEWLRTITPHKTLGRFVSRIVLEERSRREERQRIARLLEPAPVEGHEGG